MREKSEFRREIAEEVFSLVRAGRQVVPFSLCAPDFDLFDAYDVVAQVRRLRSKGGETAIGRKIGFTNRAVWAVHGIAAPMWNLMYDTTVADLESVDGVFDLAGLPEPRIEPEIAFGLSRAPTPEMDEDELIDCLAWTAHAFEIVYSIFPGWKFAIADGVAGFGLHAALLLGEKHALPKGAGDWPRALRTFAGTLAGSEGARRSGSGSDVLGGPVTALRFLVAELHKYTAEPLRLGEIVTTGTLTEAMPIRLGQVWSTSLDGVRMDGLQLEFR